LYYLKKKDYKFLAKDNETIVIDCVFLRFRTLSPVLTGHSVLL